MRLVLRHSQQNPFEIAVQTGLGHPDFTAQQFLGSARRCETKIIHIIDKLGFSRLHRLFVPGPHEPASDHD